MTQKVLGTFLLAFACLGVLGCGAGGPATAPVTGKVTMDGDPVPNALVTFVAKDKGSAATGMTDASGQYSLSTAGKEGAILGSYTVKVTSTQAPAASATEVRSDSAEYANMATGDYAAQSEAQSVKEAIPAKYNSKSELTCEVTSGSNTFDIAMESGS